MWSMLTKGKDFTKAWINAASNLHFVSNTFNGSRGITAQQKSELLNLVDSQEQMINDLNDQTPNMSLLNKIVYNYIQDDVNQLNAELESLKGKSKSKTKINKIQKLLDRRSSELEQIENNPDQNSNALNIISIDNQAPFVLNDKELGNVLETSDNLFGRIANGKISIDLSKNGKKVVSDAIVKSNINITNEIIDQLQNTPNVVLLKTEREWENNIGQKREREQTAVNKNGKKYVYLPAASLSKDFSAASHELIHDIISPILFEIGEDGKVLLDENGKSIISEEGHNLIDGFLNRLSAKERNVLKEEFDKNYGSINDRDEYFTLYHRTLVQGNYKRSGLDKVRNLINSIIKSNGYTSGDLTAKGIQSFLKDYSNDVAVGRLSDNVKTFASKQIAKGVEVETIKLSKQLGDSIKVLVPEGTTKSEYDSEVIGTVYLDLIASNKLHPLINNNLARFGVPREQVTDEFYEDVKNQLFERSLQRFNPEVNDDLGGFVINELQRFSIPDIVNQYKSQGRFQTTEQIESAPTEGRVRPMQIAEETTTEDVIERIEEQEAKVEEQTFREKLGIGKGDYIYENVVKSVRRTFGTKLPSVVDSNFRKALISEFKRDLMKPIKDFVGKKQEYKNFVFNNFDAIMEKIPTREWVRLEQQEQNKIFAEVVSINSSPTQVDNAISEGLYLLPGAARTAGPTIYRKIKTTPQQLWKFLTFNPANVNGARKTALIERIAQELAFDASIEILRDTDALGKMREIAQLNEVETVANDLAEIGKQLERDPSITKFSLSGQQANQVNDNIYKLAQSIVDNKFDFTKSIKSVLGENFFINDDQEKSFISYLKQRINKDEIDTESIKKSIINASVPIIKKYELFLGIPISITKDDFNNKNSEYYELTEDYLKNRYRALIEESAGDEATAAVEFINTWGRAIAHGQTSGNFSMYESNLDFLTRIIHEVASKTKDAITAKLGESILIDSVSAKEAGKQQKAGVRLFNAALGVIDRGKQRKDYKEFQVRDAIAGKAKNRFVKEIKALRKEYEDGNISKESILMLAIQLTDDMGSLLKLAATPTSIVIPNNIDIKELKFGDYQFVYEHNSPSSSIMLEALDHIIYGNKGYENSLNKNYEISLVVKEFDDALTAAGLKDSRIAGERYNKIEGYKEIKFSKKAKDAKGVDKEAKARDILDQTFNTILEQTTGIKATKEYSKAQARAAAQRKKYRSFFIPPSAEDFLGLMYAFLSPGKQGEKQLKFIEDNLITPMNEAFNNWAQAKYVVARDFRALRKKHKDVRKRLNKFVSNTDFTIDQVIRIYLYDKAGYTIPGISEAELKAANEFVTKNQDIYNFANELRAITRIPEGFKKPDENWIASTLTSEMYEISQNVVRSQFFETVNENLNTIFNEANLNKIEAYYGPKFREALEDSVYRIKTGSNRNFGGNRLLNQFNDWLNGSVGVIMFLNTRSAILQTISATNYINWSDNNMAKAATAFGNQGRFWSDFVYLFNSPYLKERRSGLQSDINLAELQAAIAGSKNKAKSAIRYLLQKGFIFTQIADSFAIASGGATFYRNRVKTYTKQGLSEKEAEAKAFTDFQNLTETNQQSARPDKISQQQAGPLGRLILAFQNTPAQYAREMKKASLDLINGRGDWKTNISKIVYYGAVQNLIFNAMQTALFALLFDDDDELDEKWVDQKEVRVVNGMVDSILRGTGIAGAVVATAKNVILEFIEQNEKGYQADNAAVIVEALNVSPPIGSKARKLKSALDTYKYNKDLINAYGYDIDNPLVEASANVISAATNVPLDRVLRKYDNITGALDADNTMWQRLSMLGGWSEWDVGIKDTEREEIKAQVKEEKKQAKKEEKASKPEGNDPVPTYTRKTYKR